MSSIVVSGDTSGAITISAPAVAGTTTLTLPTTSGTVLTNGTNTNFPAGSVLQVVSATYNTQVTNSTSSYVDTGLTATITPSSTSSKILVLLHQAEVGKETNNTYIAVQLLRGATVILTPAVSVGYTASSASNHTATVSAAYLDSPATTSAVTYKTNFNSQANNAIAYVQLNNSGSTLTLLEIKG